MTDHTDAVMAALRKAPAFRNVVEVDRITRLGGLTNLVHRVECAGTSVVVRLPGDGTEAYIDRAVELHNAQAAARTGVSPKVIHGNADSGLMICETVPDIETMTPDLFRARNGSPARAGQALAKLHTSGEVFQFRFELFAMIEEYLKVLSTKDVQLPDGYHDLVAAAAPIKEVLDQADTPLAPCHCDPLCENFLDDGEKMWIVDWEYSGMNDPLWDLGDLSVEAGMDDMQDAEMMAAYFGRAPLAAEMGRMVIYKAMCDLLWTLWGLIQVADENPADDFWAYSVGRFERCKTLMQGSEFEGHLAAVRKG